MGLKKLVSTNWLEKYAKHIPLSPNALTILSLLFALTGAYLIFTSNLALSIPFILLSFLLDGIDGIVARAKKQVTRFGAYLDGMADRLVEFLILSSMISLSWPDNTLALYTILSLIAFGTFLTSFAKAYADHRKAITNKKLLDRMGCIFERTERSILILASLILYLYSPLYSLYLLALGAVLAFLSFLQRFIFVMNYSKRR